MIFDHGDLLKCISEGDDCLIVKAEVKPGASRSEIAGVNTWKNCLELRVKAQAEKGKANKELIELFASLLSLTTSNIQIVKGSKKRRKLIKILGIDFEEFSRRIMENGYMR